MCQQMKGEKPSLLGPRASLNYFLIKLFPLLTATYILLCNKKYFPNLSKRLFLYHIFPFLVSLLIRKVRDGNFCAHNIHNITESTIFLCVHGSSIIVGSGICMGEVEENTGSMPIFPYKNFHKQKLRARKRNFTYTSQQFYSHFVVFLLQRKNSFTL